MPKLMHSILSKGGFGREMGTTIDFSRVEKLPESRGPINEKAKPAACIVFYEHHHFEGGIGSSFFDLSEVGDWWSDKVGSFVVAAGVWEIYTEPNFEGEPYVVGPGLYDDVHIIFRSIRSRGD